MQKYSPALGRKLHFGARVRSERASQLTAMAPPCPPFRLNSLESMNDFDKEVIGR